MQKSLIKKRLRHKVPPGVFLAWALGLVSAWAVYAGLGAIKNVPQASAPSRVSIKKMVAPRVAAPIPQAQEVVMPLNTPEAPKEKTRKDASTTAPAPQKVTAPTEVLPAPPPDAQPVEETVAVPERVVAMGEISPLMQPNVQQPPSTIEQQAQPWPSTPGSGEGSEMPGATPSPETFKLLGVEKPGGTVLVLGVLVNDSGYTENTLIVVPSSYHLKDLGFMLGYRQKIWSDITPPMYPGEKRWLEIRIDHGDEIGRANSILP